MFRPSSFMLLLAITLTSATAQTPPPPARGRPARSHRRAIRLPRLVMSRRRNCRTGENAPATVDGNFIVGPTHKPAPEFTVNEGVPQGTVFNFTMESADSKFYPGIARRAEDPCAPKPADPAQRIVNMPSCALHAQGCGLRP